MVAFRFLFGRYSFYALKDDRTYHLSGMIFFIPGCRWRQW